MAAAMTMGVGAGVYQLYAFVIMPALAKTDDRTFVAAFQQIDRAIIGPFLAVFFFGGLIFTALTGALFLSADDWAALPWIGVALGLQIVILILTVVVNVPLNDAIKDAGEPDEIDLAAVRERFNEVRWVRSNFIRVVTSTAAFGALAWALVLFGRS